LLLHNSFKKTIYSFSIQTPMLQNRLLNLFRNFKA